MTEINVVSRTQKLLVDMPSKTVSVVLAGPVGPAGPPSTAAADVNIVDAGANYTSGDVEGALQEIGDSRFYAATVAQILEGTSVTSLVTPLRKAEFEPRGDVDGLGYVTISLVHSQWGVDSLGEPYFDPDGAASGEAAWLTFDTITGSPTLIPLGV